MTRPRSDEFYRKHWKVDWFIPELEHRKYAKAFREDSDYAEEVTLYFGDVHTHSNLSPCGNVDPYNQSPAECYSHARDVVDTDFLAICDHAEKIDEATWRECMELAESTTEPGKFIAWPAVEWATGLYGHRNIYFRGYDVPLISGKDVVSPSRLWEYIRQHRLDALTIPHHAARELSADLTRTDDELEPAYEIFSGWGNEEYYGAPLQDTDRSYTRGFAVDTLLRGHRMGFVGGGDGHPAPPADNGITGIYAKDLTLDSLWEALSARRTIATTGAKIKVDFHVNGFPIGSTIRFNQDEATSLFPLEIGVAVQGTGPIEKVEIVENGVTIHTKTKPRARLDQFAYLWSYPGGPTDGSKPIGNRCNVSRFIYVRVTQRDGHMAWTSPIWLDYQFPE
jgi:hypothetical protein